MCFAYAIPFGKKAVMCVCILSMTTCLNEPILVSGIKKQPKTKYCSHIVCHVVNKFTNNVSGVKLLEKNTQIKDTTLT